MLPATSEINLAYELSNVLLLPSQLDPLPTLRLMRFALAYRFCASTIRLALRIYFAMPGFVNLVSLNISTRAISLESCSIS